jgi:glycosyltransferase involved in cell wall biosynthesis
VPILVVSTAAAGGAERALADLVEGLPDHDFAPTVLLLEPGPLAEWLAAAGCEQVVAAESAEQVPALVAQLIERTGARLVLTSKWQAQVAAAASADQLGVPVVMWQRDIAKPTPHQLAAAAQPATCIVCASRYSIGAQRTLTPEARIVQIPPGIRVAALAARATRTPAERGSRTWARPPLVGIVGRLQRFKGQHVFIWAAAAVARRREDVQFVVVGGDVLGNESWYTRWLERMRTYQRLTGRLEFVGHQADVAPWFDALDVMVHATDGEPFGLVIVEAMAMGTPVVATDVGGPSEIVEHGESGLLVPPGDPQATAEAILRILEDPELRMRLSEGGRRRAPAFTRERMTASFAELFRSLLEADHAAA